MFITRRRRTFEGSSKSTSLLAVGPFAGRTDVATNSFSSNSNTTLPGSSRPIPLKYKTFNFQALTSANINAFSGTAPPHTGIWLWADTVNIGGNGSGGIAYLNNMGTNGSDATALNAAGDAGVPRAGGSGAGGGSAFDSNYVADQDISFPYEVDGGAGSSGAAGDDGDPQADLVINGLGSSGTGTSTPGGFTLPNGGDAVKYFSGTNPGGQGYGGGGDGGGVLASGFIEAQASPYYYFLGGGGGPGGGFVCIVCRVLNLSSGFAGILTGGSNAGLPASDNAGQGSFQEIEAMGGGGGVAQIYAQQKIGSFNQIGVGGGFSSQFSFQANNGTVQLYEIGSNGTTLTLHTNLNDTWNNT